MLERITNKRSWRNRVLYGIAALGTAVALCLTPLGAADAASTTAEIIEGPPIDTTVPTPVGSDQALLFGILCQLKVIRRQMSASDVPPAEDLGQQASWLDFLEQILRILA